VQYEVHTFAHAAHRVQVPDIRLDKGDLPSPRVQVLSLSGAQVVQHRDGLAQLDQASDNVRPDESCTASHKIARHGPLVPGRPVRPMCA